MILKIELINLFKMVDNLICISDTQILEITKYTMVKTS